MHAHTHYFLSLWTERIEICVCVSLVDNTYTDKTCVYKIVRSRLADSSAQLQALINFAITFRSYSPLENSVQRMNKSIMFTSEHSFMSEIRMLICLCNSSFTLKPIMYKEYHDSAAF